MIYPLSALRAVALHTQRLDAPNDDSAPLTPQAVVDLASALGFVQIDTLHVVNRAHDVALWARFGAYATADFHRLIYTPGERRLYEGWGHAASLIPLEHYRYHRWRISRGFREWLDDPENRRLADQVLERIRAEGGLRVGEFEHDGSPRGPWYDWKPNKMALETLFAHGELMVADRVNFQRVYDLRERVLPEWVDATPVPEAEAQRFCLELAARALGVFEARHLNWYAYMWATQARPLVKDLLKQGVLVEIQGETLDGPRPWLVHRATLPLLERAAAGELQPRRTTFLSPFDSLFWAGERDQRLWGFNQVLECYKRPEQRIYGYFCFPILHRERLVGRFDPKLDRKTGELRLNALYLEPGVAPDELLLAETAAALRDFMAWHQAVKLVIAKSDPPEFGQGLLQRL
ncbi:MAG: winged helix-turn-helix domain-containing protein [Chloroflexota bacterium]